MAAAVAALPLHAGEVLLSEDFESYASTAEILDVTTGGWTAHGSNGGGMPPLLREASDRQFIEVSKDPRTGKLRNGFLTRTVPGLTEANTVRLKFRMLHGSEKTGQYAGLFDAERMKGYAVYWTAGEGPTTGVVRLLRFDATSPVEWSDLGEEIGVVKNADVHHIAREMPLAEFDLLLDLESGEMTLAMDGQEKLSLRDPEPLRGLDQIVLRGNGGGFFDDLEVSSP